MKLMLNFIILSLFFLYGCNNNKNETSTNKQNNVSIDTVKINYQEFEKYYFNIDVSFLPKIKGLEDTVFQNKINKIFIEKFNLKVEEFKKKKGGYGNDYVADENDYRPIPATLRSSFDILTKNDSIISIVLFITEEGYGGCNNWYTQPFSLTINYKKNIIYDKKDFNLDKSQVYLINNKIKNYFDKLFPPEELFSFQKIDYPFVTSLNELNNLNLGIRNDSLVIIVWATPLEHSSSDIYIIPVKSMNSK